MSSKPKMLLAGAALAAPMIALSEPAWPADFAEKEAARRVAAVSECATVRDVTLASYDTWSWTVGILTGLGTAGTPFEMRTFTWEDAVCEWLLTYPKRGFIMILR